ncbi:hypothetical protein ACFIOY_23055 [Bradyrhizobium sp. TZ2]
MTINELLGELNSLGLIVAKQINAVLNVAVRPKDIRAVILHLWAPKTEP